MSSHPNELYFSQYHQKNCNDNTPEKFRYVSQTIALQQIISHKLGYEIKTNRVGTKHTQRCNVQIQLNEAQIKEIDELANITFKYMNGDQLNNETFRKIYGFWKEIKGGISSEWQLKILQNKKQMLVDDHNCKAQGRYARILNAAKHKPVKSQAKAHFIKQIYQKIAEQIELKRRGRKAKSKTRTISYQDVANGAILFITKI
ncbi:Hypothetical_protein [Hexamita inflata]|uniref:Hypothetical_protein n=1 Tax=Hexamita inflata TaxID=28002 RepID=A0AA86QGE8_9EUKA|nr:Hypothetical protein HINF_LOCUS46519 [Hexamita inflata]